MSGGRLPKLRHSITVYAIQVLPLRYSVNVLPSENAASSRTLAKAGWTWVPLSKLGSLPLASAEKKLLVNLKKALEPGSDAGAQMGLLI